MPNGSLGPADQGGGSINAEDPGWSYFAALAWVATRNPAIATLLQRQSFRQDARGGDRSPNARASADSTGPFPSARREISAYVRVTSGFDEWDPDPREQAKMLRRCEEDLLNSLVMGRIVATGIPDDREDRVPIPADDWVVATVGPRPNDRMRLDPPEASPAPSTAGYGDVRLNPDHVKCRWPAIESEKVTNKEDSWSLEQFLHWCQFRTFEGFKLSRCTRAQEIALRPQIRRALQSGALKASIGSAKREASGAQRSADKRPPPRNQEKNSIIENSSEAEQSINAPAKLDYVDKTFWDSNSPEEFPEIRFRRLDAKDFKPSRDQELVDRLREWHRSHPSDDRKEAAKFLLEEARNLGLGTLSKLKTEQTVSSVMGLPKRGRPKMVRTSD